MNKSPLVSIIMNCYNGEKYLNASLNSILQQTHQNWELIFWDNISSDNSKKFLKNSMTKDLNIFQQKNIQSCIMQEIWQYDKRKVNLQPFLIQTIFGLKINQSYKSNYFQIKISAQFMQIIIDTTIKIFLRKKQLIIKNYHLER